MPGLREGVIAGDSGGSVMAVDAAGTYCDAAIMYLYDACYFK
jgi:hypothetical protein